LAADLAAVTAAAPEPFRADLAGCDREPIHIPGAVQPHGALLVLREPDLSVLQASENTGALFGVPVGEVLGKPVDAVVGAEGAAALRDALAGDDLAAVNPLRMVTGGRAWDGIVHRTEAGAVLELEPAEAADPRSVGGLYGRVRQALAAVQGAATLAALCDAMAVEVRRLTGLGRVTVYRFDADWHGEVVAEARDPAMDSFLGLHFPASDIPAQARELYRRNWLRLIADVGYVPARIVPALSPVTGAPLDLSGAALRSVSPVHLEYLRNMGVGASMSVSLLQRGELWGLVACHHPEPRYVPYEVRTACELLGQAFSVQLGSVAEIEDRAYELRVASVGARLLDRTAADADWVRALTQGSPGLPELADAGGAAVWSGGAAVRVGATPDDAQIAALVEWLAVRDADVFHTDHLAAELPAAAEYASVAAGVLAVPVSRATGDFLLWFRPEAVRTVEWAGNPEKPVRPASPQGESGDAHPPTRSADTGSSGDATTSTVPAQSGSAPADAGDTNGRSGDALPSISRTDDARLSLETSSDPRGTAAESADAGQASGASGDAHLLTGAVHPGSESADAARSHGGLDDAGRGGASGDAKAAADAHLPIDPAVADAAGRTMVLHPRQSFAAWRETVRGRSLPWKPAEVRAAAELRGRIVDVVLRNADQLATVNAELQRSNEELDAFTYIASHDLKEPLRGIHSFSRMLMEDRGEALAPEGREQVETLLRLSARMHAMLDSLLLYSRAGKLELRRTDVDLHELVAEVLDTLASRLAEKGTDVRVPRRLPTVRCDPVRAGSVFQNLISNAIKYNDAGSPWVEVGYAEQGPGRPDVLYVRDNGIGIDPKHWDAVFRIFKRLHGRDKFGGGAGAGLTIARRLVERHGGRIWLESAPGEGTTFFFTLQADPCS
jgi:light-regulated signal transduction histidine kinase (bacteriophytochrome)